MISVCQGVKTEVEGNSDRIPDRSKHNKLQVEEFDGSVEYFLQPIPEGIAKVRDRCDCGCEISRTRNLEKMNERSYCLSLTSKH